MPVHRPNTVSRSAVAIGSCQWEGIGDLSHVRHRPLRGEHLHDVESDANLRIAAAAEIFQCCARDAALLRSVHGRCWARPRTCRSRFYLNEHKCAFVSKHQINFPVLTAIIPAEQIQSVLRQIRGGGGLSGFTTLLRERLTARIQPIRHLLFPVQEASVERVEKLNRKGRLV